MRKAEGKTKRRRVGRRGKMGKKADGKDGEGGMEDEEGGGKMEEEKGRTGKGIRMRRGKVEE